MSRLTAHPIALGLAGVTAAGLVVRTIPLALADFPVNDGGLFMAMVRAIQDAGWALPDTVAWNGEDLPFTYPPLAFYKAGLLETIFGLDLFGVFRWLPLVASSLIVPAVFLLASAALRSRVGGLVAALVYALTPSSYVWLIQGGGVTRSPGLLLAVLCLWRVVLLVRDPGRGSAVIVGVLAALTALVHPGAAVFVAVSAPLIWIFEGRTRASLASAAAAVGVAAVIVAPWALAVISRHGLAALTDVRGNGPDPVAALVALFAGRITGVPFTDPLAIIGLAMSLICLIRRQFLLPVWLVASLLLSYQYAMVPFALLVGVLAADLLSWWRNRATAPNSPRAAARWAPLVVVAVLAASLVVEAGASALIVHSPGAPVHALSPERRSALEWASVHLEPAARVAVITDSVWNSDPDSEWFPLLAGRQSVATVQGSELLGAAAFDAAVNSHHELQSCVRPASVACVRDWLAVSPAEYVYLPDGHLHGPNSPADCCADLRALLLAEAGFEPVYQAPGATILAVQTSAAAAGQ